MKTDLLNYCLPVELIAQQPARSRSDSRLLVFNRNDNRLLDSCFEHLTDFLSPGDCLVLNDTKVLPARFFARRKSGGKLEALFLLEKTGGFWEIMLKGAKKVKVGEEIYLKSRQSREIEFTAELVEKIPQGRCILKVESQESTEEILEKIGFPPLPPYIKRTDDPNQARQDKIRYQTVYAQTPGAVAAPTAGLHFTDKLIEALKNKGIHFAYITLHVGAGTFKPVTTENLEDHLIHTEKFSVNQENADIINSARQKGGRIIAVGTTTVRTLETIGTGLRIDAGRGVADLFIRPGFKFKIVDAMVTNFHLPKSTLLALVAAFAGLENTLAAYQHAIEQKYRFYSYGDAMLIL